MTSLDGLHYDLDEAAYHRDPALSASGAKRLLPPNCPALFKHDRDNGGRPNKRTFDFGHAAHAAVLGVGLEVVVVQKVTKDKQRVDASDYTTKSAQAHRDEIYAAGKCPVLADEKLRVDEMANALRKHPIARRLLDREHGRPEVSFFWHDEQRGLDRRARFDWLPDAAADGRIVLPDYKTTASAEPRKFHRSIFDFGYDVQSVWYTDAVQAAGLADDVEFQLIAQETKPPYLITVHTLDHFALMVGRERVNAACALFVECTSANRWPGYSDEVEYVAAPDWLAAQYGMDLVI